MIRAAAFAAASAAAARSCSIAVRSSAAILSSAIRVRRSISASASVFALATISSASCRARSSSASRSLSAEAAFASYSAFSASASLRSDFGLGELIADQRDLAVERPADRAGHLLPDEEREHDEHRQRDPAARIEAEGGRLCRFGRSATAAISMALDIELRLHRCSGVLARRPSARSARGPFPASLRRQRLRSPPEPSRAHSRILPCGGLDLDD